MHRYVSEGNIGEMQITPGSVDRSKGGEIVIFIFGEIDLYFCRLFISYGADKKRRAVKELKLVGSCIDILGIVEPIEDKYLLIPENIDRNLPHRR